jgi:cyanophycin synthetase
MQLDLQELEDLPTNKIDGFADRLQEAMPSIYGHRCSEGKPGGFLERVRRGTWMGHVVEHIALELQTLAGMECGFGRTRSAGPSGVYNVVFAYQVERAGIYAAKAAVKMAEVLSSDRDYDISEDIKELARINQQEGIGPSTLAIVNEAKKRNIPYRRLDNQSLVMLGQGVHQRIIRATMACTTSSIGVDMAGDKQETKRILSEGYIPLPKGEVVNDIAGLHATLNDIGFPAVIKPVNGNHGRGITTNIQNMADAEQALAKAKVISDEVIVERFINGKDYRFLVIDYKLAAIARRTPAMVVGDDESTIQQLIDQTNSEEERGEGHEKPLTTIKVDAATNSILVKKNLTLNSVLPCGEVLYLKDTANLSTGGTAKDVSDIVHPYNVFIAERIARLMNLDICGIDIIAEDIKIPINEKNGAVLEVNAGPGFRMHLAPSSGLARNVAEPVINMLYPQGAPSRIPIVAVTGTNGKTTTTRLVAHLAKTAGHTVGLCTTDGIYIQDQPVCYGDCSGPSSAAAVLRDPIVDFAALECARGGILRSGLGFDKCDISIITNITDDHLGIDGIDTVEELAKVKGVVAQSTVEQGYAILNADDDIVYNLREDLDCNVALFSIRENNRRIISHCKNGGIAAVVEQGYFTIYKGDWKTKIAKVKDVPLTLEGKAECMVKNVLPAILAATIRGFGTAVIRNGLQTFVPSPQTTPGRMNIFDFRSFKVMVDYAHNTDGFIHLKKYLEQSDASPKIGVIAAPGDRRDEDIRNAGACAASTFDEVIIKHDADGRGRTNAQITQLLMEGIQRVNPQLPVTVISNEKDAIYHAIEHARQGSLVVVWVDKVMEIIEYVSKMRDAATSEKDFENVYMS